MRGSDINDNLVTFSTRQHVRLKIKQEGKVLSCVQEGLSRFPPRSFSFSFPRAGEGRRLGAPALIVTGKALQREAGARQPPAAWVGDSGGGRGLLLKRSAPLTSDIVQTVTL